MLDVFDPQAQPGALVVRDPAAIAAAETAKALVQAAYVMALQKPRDEDQARHNILRACGRPQFAERVEYSKPVGGDKIKGPSIRFAEAALQAWGNIRVDTAVVYDDDNLRRIRVTCTDLETNSSFGKEIQITKTVERSKAGPDREVVSERKNTRGQTVYIVRATDDELAIKEAALISKVVRNEGLRLIPADVVDDALEVARQTKAAKDAKDPEEAKKRVLDSFASLGVQPKDLQAYLGHALDTVVVKELEDLRATYQAIKEGETTWHDCLAAKVAEREQPSGGGQPEPPEDRRPELYAKLYELAQAKGLTTDDDQENLAKYIGACAAHFKRDETDILADALERFEAHFWPTYLKWGGCTYKPATAEPPAQAEKQAAKGRGKGSQAQPAPAAAATTPPPPAQAHVDEMATQEQFRDINVLLTQRQADQRFNWDVDSITAKICTPSLTFADARAIVDGLVAEPPVWDRVDQIVTGAASQGAPEQPGLGL